MLNDLTPQQVETVCHLKDELLALFDHQLVPGHLVRDAEGIRWVLDEESNHETFLAHSLTNEQTRTLTAQECNRVLSFELPLAERQAFEVLAQRLEHEAAAADLPNDRHYVINAWLDRHFEYEDPAREHHRGFFRHWLYARFAFNRRWTKNITGTVRV